MKNVMFIMPIIISFVIFGCALTLPMATTDQDIKAKTFTTRNDKANIYVYRNEIFAFAVALPLVLDGKSVGALAAKTYLLLVVQPGEHRLLCDSENGSVLRLSVEAGRNYFVWLEAKTGFINLRSNLQIVDEINGRKGVEECSLIEAAN